MAMSPIEEAYYKMVNDRKTKAQAKLDTINTELDTLNGQATTLQEEITLCDELLVTIST